jgi:hypothetical protein
MRPEPILLENGNQFTDFSANENGFGCIQNQSLDKCKANLLLMRKKCKQISQFIVHENGFGCAHNQSSRKMEVN